ncbi:ribulose-phosphate 3-epimerase [Clostridium felsineum]|uniref:Ribulose-phosphate 3-epimerase n=1 Tax=Clostridium felsineum TaxID=36839 RepID=A0A1S8LMU6_9CLOT|nr:ribulose-phosphate 3-epimerase [Clostridium felsineum]URZ06555.1 Ribulose-phosphate 3-epimerase [Clostridium felsineum]URZ11590.1 Ribulose-phosphate 3-epimerase [Clostridium felsineum]
MIKLAPSILAADFSKLGEEIKKLDEAGADIIHIDIMDGNFVPNISFGLPVVRDIRKYTKLPFDVHLMIEEPSKYVEQFAKIGADIISIHYESDKHIDRTLNYIKSLGVKAAVAINPGTPTTVLRDLMNIADMVVIMSVNPGFGGQKYIDYSYDKIREIKSYADKLGRDILIEVDGGVDKDNIKKVKDAGANVIVAGSAVFKNGDIKKNIELLKGSM